jgi:hypothetical protein
MRYAVIGGAPFTGYTGTLTFTSLRVVGTTSTLKQAEKLASENYDSSGGLLLVLDLETGAEATRRQSNGSEVK